MTGCLCTVRCVYSQYSMCVVSVVNIPPVWFLPSLCQLWYSLENTRHYQIPSASNNFSLILNHIAITSVTAKSRKHKEIEKLKWFQKAKTPPCYQITVNCELLNKLCEGKTLCPHNMHDSIWCRTIMGIPVEVFFFLFFVCAMSSIVLIQWSSLQ